MWTRGRDKNDKTKFAYSLYDASGSLMETVGGFTDHRAADRAAEIAQRRVLFVQNAFDISDDELLAELLK